MNIERYAIMPKIQYMDIINKVREKTGISSLIFSDEISKILETTQKDESTLNTLLDRSFTRIKSYTETIGDYAFYDSKNLVEVVLPKVKTMGGYCFYGCTGLTEINLPNLEKITGSYCFQNCSGLISVKLPNLKTITANQGLGCFNSCTSLEEITLENLTILQPSFFNKCTNLKKVSLPKCKAINYYSFMDNSNLIELDIPLVEQIGMQTFTKCTALEKLYCPSLTQLSGASVFLNCTNLTALIISNTKQVCTLANANAFTGTPIESGTGYIYVPQFLVDSYKENTNWSVYSEQIRAIEDYPDILI